MFYLVWDHTKKTTKNGWFSLYTTEGILKRAKDYPKEIPFINSQIADKFVTVWPKNENMPEGQNNTL